MSMDAVLGIGGSLLAAGGENSAAPSFEGMAIYLAITLGIIFFLASQMRKGIGPRVFSTRIALWAEHAYIFVENLCVGIIGAHGRRYIPMMMTFWLIIFVANLIALFSPYSVTADLGFNLGMALVAIGYVQYEGIRANGFMGHFSHFAGPKLGGAMVIISGMIFIIEIISETMKNVSLSLRLFGNIEGGHLVTDSLNNLLVFEAIGYKWGFPLGALLIPIKLMTCLVQAMIFTLLTCVYLSLVTHHDHGDDHGHGHESGGELASAH